MDLPAAEGYLVEESGLDIFVGFGGYNNPRAPHELTGRTADGGDNVPAHICLADAGAKAVGRVEAENADHDSWESAG
jgi:hypothetical protein